MPNSCDLQLYPYTALLIKGVELPFCIYLAKHFGPRCVLQVNNMIIIKGSTYFFQDLIAFEMLICEYQNTWTGSLTTKQLSKPSSSSVICCSTKAHTPLCIWVFIYSLFNIFRLNLKYCRRHLTLTINTTLRNFDWAICSDFKRLQKFTASGSALELLNLCHSFSISTI